LKVLNFSSSASEGEGMNKAQELFLHVVLD
jgi:hypothetical protein